MIAQRVPGVIPRAVARDPVDQDHISLDVPVDVGEESLAGLALYADFPADLGVDQVPGTADVRAEEPQEGPQSVAPRILRPTIPAILEPFLRPPILRRGLAMLFATPVVGGPTTAPASLRQQLRHVRPHIDLLSESKMTAQAEGEGFEPSCPDEGRTH
jgi:hypothetical protein